MKTICRIMGLAAAVLLMFLPASGSAAGPSPLAFDEDGSFSVLLIADPQDTENPQAAMLELLNASLDTAKPDLVIYLGDMIHGPSVHGEENVKKAIDAIVRPVTDRNIPFALVFGNHDHECGMSNDELMEIYLSYPGCLAEAGEEMPGCGNYYIVIDNPVKPESPVVLWCLDSGDYAEPGKGKYGYVTEEQNAWMLREYEALRAKYGEPASYAFQHIPVPQVYGMMKEVPFGTNGGAMRISQPTKWYTLNDEFVWAGHLGEGPAASEYDSGEFKAWKRMSLRAAFFGHDHVNDYCGTYEGIDLIATSGLGFYMYGRGDEHGARIVKFSASAPEKYETKMLYYKDIVSTPMPGLFVPTLGVMIQQYIFLAIGAIIVITAVIIVSVRIRRRRKKASA